MAIDARIPLMAVSNPVNILEFENGRQAAQRTEANQLAMDQARVGQVENTAKALARGVLTSENKPEAYRMALEQARRAGMNVDAFPTEWGPDADMALRMVAMDGAARTKLQAKIEAMRAAGYSDEDIKRAVGVDAGIVPRATAGGGPKAPTGYRMREDGNLEFIPGGPADPAVRKANRGPGTTVYDPNTGKPIATINGEPLPLGRTTTNTLEKDIAAGDENQARLDRLGEVAKIDPATGKLTPEGRRMFTLSGKVAETITNWQDYLDLPDWVPVIGGKPDPEALKFLQERKAMSTAAAQLFNEYRKEITGAAAAVAELNRLEAAFVNPKMGPTEFEAVYAETQEMFRRIREVRVALLQRGIDPKTPEGGAKMDAIIGGADIDSVAPAGTTAPAATGGAPPPGAATPPAAAKPNIGDMSTDDLMKMYRGE